VGCAKHRFRGANRGRVTLKGIEHANTGHSESGRDSLKRTRKPESIEHAEKKKKNATFRFAIGRPSCVGGEEGNSQNT